MGLGIELFRETLGEVKLHSCAAGLVRALDELRILVHLLERSVVCVVRRCGPQNRV